MKVITSKLLNPVEIYTENASVAKAPIVVGSDVTLTEAYYPYTWFTI